MSTHHALLDDTSADAFVRAGEQARTWFRSERIYLANGAWWFACRDGIDQGPYPDRQEAEGALIEFLRAIATANGSWDIR